MENKIRQWKESDWGKGAVRMVKKTDLSDGKKPVIKAPRVRELQVEGKAGGKAAGQERAMPVQVSVSEGWEGRG